MVQVDLYENVSFYLYNNFKFAKNWILGKWVFPFNGMRWQVKER